MAIAGEAKAHEVSRGKKTPDSNARSKTLNQNQSKVHMLGGLCGGPAGVLRDPGIGPSGCTVRLRIRWVSNRDRHAHAYAHCNNNRRVGDRD